MNNKKNGFTLLELMISIGIISLLFVVLFRAYTTISQVTFRVQQEKNIQQELIRIAQTLQNIADNHSIDYEKYNSEENTQTTENIQSKKTSTIQNKSLFLSGSLGRITITTTGICNSDYPEITGFNQQEKEEPCQLILIQNDTTITPLTNPGESYISKPHFTIFPAEKNEAILKSETKFPFLYIRQPSFQVHFSIYTPLYQKGNRINMSSTIFQQFFNLQK